MDENATGGTDSDRITVDLPANLIAQMDAQVGSVFVDRAEFIRTAVRHYLEYMQKAQSTDSSDIG